MRASLVARAVKGKPTILNAHLRYKRPTVVDQYKQERLESTRLQWRGLGTAIVLGSVGVGILMMLLPATQDSPGGRHFLTGTQNRVWGWFDRVFVGEITEDDIREHETKYGSSVLLGHGAGQHGDGRAEEDR